MALVAIAPFGPALEWWLGIQPFRMTETFVMAFLAAWLLRANHDRQGPRVPRLMRVSAWLLALAAVASVCGLAFQLSTYPGELSDAAIRLAQAYFIFDDRIGFVAAARLLEACALVAATLFVFRHRPSLADTCPAALCAGGAAAAALTLLIWRGIGPDPLVANHTRIGYRVAHIYDFNAAGSYFGMLLCTAAGMTLRYRGRVRAMWIAAAVMTAIGLWFTESKSAMAAAAITLVLAAAWLATRSWTMRMRIGALTVLALLSLGAGAVRIRLLERDPMFRGGGFRQEFSETSARMIATRPQSGVGIGQYYAASPLFLTPHMAWTYGFENAHNYFLQVAAELGIPGVLLFVAWLGTAVVIMGRAIASTPEPRLLGLAAGVIAFLATCLTGHPLLWHEVAVPFWVQLAMGLGLAESALTHAATDPRTPIAAPWASRATGLAAAVIVLSAVWSARGGPLGPPSSRAVDGLYEWETSEDGRRFRWTEQYASLFVPADISVVYIPVRVPSDRPALSPMGVEVRVGGVRQSRTLVDNTWGILVVPMPEVAPPTRFKRVDLKVDRAWQPALYVAGSADFRTVGVQMGEPELAR
jgi:O-antigen ligase